MMIATWSPSPPLGDGVTSLMATASRPALRPLVAAPTSPVVLRLISRRMDDGFHMGQIRLELSAPEGGEGILGSRSASVEALSSQDVPGVLEPPCVRDR